MGNVGKEKDGKGVGNGNGVANGWPGVNVVPLAGRQSSGGNATQNAKRVA